MTAPTLIYANFPTPITSVFDTTSFTCNYGYISSNAPNPPFYTCEPINATNGFWSAVINNCVGVFVTLYLT